MNATHVPDAHRKLLLIDDDPFFRSLMEVTAESMGIYLKTFDSVAEMGSFARIKEFSAALLDYNLEHLNGVEIAEYIDTFFANIPVLIVTGGDLSKISHLRWPDCIKGLRSKARPPKELLADACGLIERQDFLRSFEVPKYDQVERQVVD